MRISVVIPTFNRLEKLKSLILNIESQKIDDEINLSIVVVNDGSTDGTDEYLKLKNNIHTIHGDGNWWYTRSVNEGFKYAISQNAEYIIALNDDLILPEDYIDSILKAQESVGQDTIIGSISITQNEPHRIFFSGIKSINFFSFSVKSYYPFMQVVDTEKLNGIYPTYSLPGRGMFIPSHILKELNFFDNSYIQYGSDTDFCYKAIKKGYKIYVSYDAKVYTFWKETGAGSPFIKQNFWIFIRNVFINPYSARYIGNTIFILYRYFNKWLFPFLLIKAIFARFKSYYKNKKYWYNL